MDTIRVSADRLASMLFMQICDSYIHPHIPLVNQCLAMIRTPCLLTCMCGINIIKLWMTGVA